MVLLISRTGIVTLLARASRNTQRVFRHIATLSFLEMGAAFGVAFFSSLIIITTPPVFDTRSGLTTESENIQITLERSIHEKGELEVSLMPSTGIKNVSVELSSASIGPIIPTLTQQSPGHYVFSDTALVGASQWSARIVAQQENDYDAVAMFEFPYPDGLEPSSHVGFRTFEMLVVFVAFGALLVGALLWRFVSVLERNAAALTETPLQVSFKNAYASGFFALLLLILLLYPLSDSLFKSSFRKLCEQNGHAWITSVPMKAGMVLSPRAIAGCMAGTGAGTYHLTREEEYLMFSEPVRSIGELEVPQVVNAETPIDFVFRVLDEEGNPATDLSIEHDRLIHIIVVSEDIQVFSHIHPDDETPITKEMITNARFPFHYTFPRSGRYLIAIDWAVRSQHQSQQFIVEVAPVIEVQAVPDFGREKLVEGYEISSTLPESGKAGDRIQFSYLILKNGQKVLDLEPYLGAPMHIAVVRHDLRRFIHTHGMLPRSLWQLLFGPRGAHAAHQALPKAFGPRIDAEIIFPNPGVYSVFAEFKHDRKSVVTSFDIKIE